MKSKTKITLSAKELNLVCNADFILTKQAIIKKVYQLMGELSENWQQQLSQFQKLLPPEMFLNSPKISKGENYRDLPYVILDYPRCFGKEDTLAIRLFFWWGNFFSISIHLSGYYQSLAVPFLVKNFVLLQKNEYSICNNETPWEHHFLDDNFTCLKRISLEKFTAILTEKPFIKIAKKIPLNEWEKVAAFMEQSFADLIMLAFIKHPNDEKGLSPGIPITGSDL